MGKRSKGTGKLAIEKKLVMQEDDYIYGSRAVIEAIENGRTIERVLIKKGLKSELHHEVFELIKENRIPFQNVPVEKINRITRKNHQGIIAFLSPVEFFNIRDVLPGIFEKGMHPFILMLDQITDVRNFGAIVRSAECARINVIIIPEKGMAKIGADAVKTSAGALHHMTVCRENNLASAVSFLKNSGVKTIAANEKATTLYTRCKMNLPLAIVMGSEEKGISKSVLDEVDEQVKIPVLGKIGSLNVSVAAALMIYEAVRQQTHN